LKTASVNSSQDLISKITNTKKGWQGGSSGRVPSKHEALNSKPSTTKAKQNKTKKEQIWEIPKFVEIKQHTAKLPMVQQQQQ
jgi:hypothetical protein